MKKKCLLIILTTLPLLSCTKSITTWAIRPKIDSVETTVSTINSGTIKAQKEAELSFGTVGRISSLHVSLGKIVEKGALIAEIENNDLKAVALEAQNEYQRAIELFQSTLISKSQLESAKRAFLVAQSNLDKTMIKAPFKGMMTAFDIKVGEFYQNQTAPNARPKIQLIDLDQRIVQGEIDEIDLPKIKYGQKARVKIPAYKNKIFNATVTKVVPFVSTAKDQDRTSQIELILTDNEKGFLIPVGVSADVEIIVNTKMKALILPTSYLQGVPKDKFVLKVEKNRLVKNKVELGVGNYDRTEILNGVTVNDLIARPPEGVEDFSKVKVTAEEKPWP